MSEAILGVTGNDETATFELVHSAAGMQLTTACASQAPTSGHAGITPAAPPPPPGTEDPENPHGRACEAWSLLLCPVSPHNLPLESTKLQACKCPWGHLDPLAQPPVLKVWQNSLPVPVFAAGAPGTCATLALDPAPELLDRALDERLRLRPEARGIPEGPSSAEEGASTDPSEPATEV